MTGENLSEEISKYLWINLDLLKELTVWKLLEQDFGNLKWFEYIYFIWFLVGLNIFIRDFVISGDCIKYFY